MKTKTYALAAAFLTSCVELDERVMQCYKFDTCLKETPVTGKVVNIDYQWNQNGMPEGVLITDQVTGIKYRLMRKNDASKEFMLEKIASQQRSDCPYYANCDW